jgi:hypothetical protein
VIDDAQDDRDGETEVTGVKPFRLWPLQVQTAWQMQSHKLLIILKARQLGLSWLCCAYALWLCIFKPNRLVLLISLKEKKAAVLLNRILKLYDRLPAWMRELSPLKRRLTNEAEWVNGSRIMALASNAEAGRSEGPSLIIIDEAAIIANAAELIAAAKPAIDQGGQMILLSTAKGVGNAFHRIWVKAKQGLNGFLAVFLPYWTRPERDAAWYAAKLAEADDKHYFRQEFPRNDKEAFILSGRVRFNPDHLERQEANIRDPLPWEAVPHHLSRDGWKWYEIPDPLPQRFVISADVAEGLIHGDASCAHVFDEATWREVGCFHSHNIDPDSFGRELAKIGEALSIRDTYPPIVVERNNHGHTVLASLAREGYPNIAHGHDDRPGWLSDVKHKPQSIDAVNEALRDDAIVIRSEATLAEMRIYERKDNGKTGAPEGMHDDRVMALAVGLGWITLIGTAVIEIPNTNRRRA